jgi:Arc/MetJ-type ribon-helix-helix transcriptional regulator
MQAKSKRSKSTKPIVGFSIPQELHERAVRRFTGEFANFSEYARQLIRDDVERHEEESAQ